VTSIVGPDAFRIRAEASLPERAQRRWERRESTGDGE
jgi:cytidylate kinase